MQKILICIALILTIIGGLNWGAHAAGFNLVENTVGPLSNYVYYIVAAASLTTLVFYVRGDLKCSPKEETKKE